MTEEELNSLGARAVEAFEEQRFDDEAKLWEQIAAAFPDRHHYLSNLASARMNQGRLDEALDLFDEVLQKAPHLSRAHNNRAVLLLVMGADIQNLVPAFAIALEKSHDFGEFVRHLLNLCNAAAYGPDSGGMRLLDAIEKSMQDFVAERHPADQQVQASADYSKLIDAYRHIRRFRKAIAERRWIEAKVALSHARSLFTASEMENLARGVDGLLVYLEATRMVFEALEKIGNSEVLNATEARDLMSARWHDAARLRLKDPAGGLTRLVDVLGWFLTLFLHEVTYLAEDGVEYHHIDDDTQVMIWLTSSSFRRLGDDLISIVNSGDKICRRVCEANQRTANLEDIRVAKAEAWLRLCLAVNVRVFDLAGVDIELARRALAGAGDPLGRVREELADFRSFVERQSFRDVFVDSRPQENIARALLQARLRGRSYREVPTRGGRTDLLVFADSADGRVLIEAKIWRGEEYFEQGLREIAEYVLGEHDDGKLIGTFYVIFDASVGARAVAHIGSAVSTRRMGDLDISVLVINLRPPQPSKA